MLRRVLMMLVLCWLGPFGFSQETYRAVFTGGRVYVAQENRFSQIHNGQSIAADAQIELVGNALLVLMNAEGRLASYDLSGKYDLARLDKSVMTDSSTFIKSVWDQYYAQYREQFSVEEQLLREPAVPFRTNLELLIPSSSQVFGDKVRLQWSLAGLGAYKVHLINEFGEVFNTLDVFRNEITIDLLTQELVWKPELTLRISTMDGGHRSPLYTLRKLTPPDYERMRQILEKHFTENTLPMRLTRAAFFENQWLFADAQTLLLNLRAEYGNVIAEFWENYLIRNGFYAMSRQ